MNSNDIRTLFHAYVATVSIGFLALIVLGLVAPPKAHAFEIPFDWKCNSAGTSCRAPGLNPPAKPFPASFFARFEYPKKIIVRHREDYDAVAKGWTKTGDCKALIRDADYPDVALAKAQHCKFWQVGYAAPKPKIVKGW